MIGRKITIGDYLTDDEIKLATEIYNEHGIKKFAHLCQEKIIEPNIDRINKAIGHECDPQFLAYCVEYALLQIEKKHRPKVENRKWRI